MIKLFMALICVLFTFSWAYSVYISFNYLKGVYNSKRDKLVSIIKVIVSILVFIVCIIILLHLDVPRDSCKCDRCCNRQELKYSK